MPGPFRTAALAAALCAAPAASMALPPEGGVDYQLGGGYPPDPRVAIVVRDSTDAPSPGHYNICYVNGFQTQPGALDWWLTHHPQSVLRADGKPVADPGWPDEYALDTTTAAARAGIVEAVGMAIRRCAEAGFDAVEFDNLDSWTRFNGLSLDGNLALASQLVAVAHDLKLAAGQKNAPDLAAHGPAAGFDFVISEECAVWDGCGSYRAHYGDRHIDVEYDDAPKDGLPFDQLCALPDQPRRTVLRDRLLLRRGEPGYVFNLCPPR
ncbi:endo alpha-1,4 polygalactosaminidase [Falsirhodobacter xinxiangensis]|uniref:endo alpha-1,4 polygalactosaminidase n=1 Tax=Falsirhodobacter xinxiangensis TaxID=2530049 RepID=UPI0010A9DD76|nr:endo alpha-1,4 polygalactosaminidase [Rhodobacter xinxiangensis]